MNRAIALLALTLAVGAAEAQELGRLFFTPEQRAALDARRKARLPDNPVSVAARPVTRVDGFVKRSTGPSTIWINGEWTTESSPEAPRITEPSPSVSVTVGETGGRVRLKPGETLDRGNGEVRDVIGDGEIQIRPQRGR
ncbi:MAG TPA: hypothetical protein VFJ70_14240 [Burkholderiales bacterium]|nr:hypothetical protein [Burkholderiales bacterium]